MEIVCIMVPVEEGDMIFMLDFVWGETIHLHLYV